MNKEIAIQAEQITKTFGDFTAVDHISFEVKKGEIFGFLGANGAGKTTAMRMFCGLSIPTSGKAMVAGFDVYKNAEQIKKNIGYMSQKFSLYENLSILENLEFFGGIYGLSMKEIKQKSKELIEKLGLICLVITDVDSINPNDNGKKCQPELGKNYKTNNDTLKTWHPQKELLDELLNLNSDDKIKKDLPIRVAYQKAIEFDNGGDKTIVYPYTFEDALVIENKDNFKAIADATGLLKKMVEASKKEDLKELVQETYTIINDKQAKKAEFALDILYFEDPKKIKTPSYIKEGLNWIEEQLKSNKQGLIN